VSGTKDTIHYTLAQEEHHRQRNVREELEIFLKKHGDEDEIKALR
jgi:hypothetical protein